MMKKSRILIIALSTLFSVLTSQDYRQTSRIGMSVSFAAESGTLQSSIELSGLRLGLDI